MRSNSPDWKSNASFAGSQGSTHSHTKAVHDLERQRRSPERIQAKASDKVGGASPLLNVSMSGEKREGHSYSRTGYHELVQYRQCI